MSARTASRPTAPGRWTNAPMPSVATRAWNARSASSDAQRPGERRHRVDASPAEDGERLEHARVALRRDEAREVEQPNATSGAALGPLVAGRLNLGRFGNRGVVDRVGDHEALAGRDPARTGVGEVVGQEHNAGEAAHEALGASPTSRGARTGAQSRRGGRPATTGRDGPNAGITMRRSRAWPSAPGETDGHRTGAPGAAASATRSRRRCRRKYATRPACAVVTTWSSSGAPTSMRTMRRSPSSRLARRSVATACPSSGGGKAAGG